jgi:phosphoserine phosphatase
LESVDPNFQAKIVIFDLDKTLATCNVSFLFGRALYKRARLSFFTMIWLVSVYYLHKIGILPVRSLHKAAFKKIFHGKGAAELEVDIKMFFEHEQALYRLPLVVALQNAQGMGQIVWIQSSSPYCLVAPIAQFFGIQMVTATQYMVDSAGTYSELGDVVDGEYKKKELVYFLEKNNIKAAEVVAYSDSILDLPLLETVGRPIVVCPDAKLKAVAHMRSWQILDL